MRPCLGLILVLALPISAQTINMGPEVAASDPILIAAPDEQSPAQVATDGSGFLTVWQDSRLNGMIFGARLDAGGKLLDPTGLLLSATPGEFTRQANGANAKNLFVLKSSPAVAWNGSEYVVVWGTSSALKMTRVLPSGEILEREKTLLAGNLSAVGIGWNTKNLLLAYNIHESDGAEHGYVRLIAKDGHPLSIDQPVPTAPGLIDVIASHSSFAIVGGRLGVFVDESGKAGRSFVANAGNMYVPVRPHVATDGDSFVLNNYYDISKVSGTGEVLKSSKIDYSSTPLSSWIDAIVWSGSSYQVIQRGAVVVRLDADLNVLQRRDSPYKELPQSREWVRAATNGATTLVIGRSRAGYTGSTDLYASFAPGRGRLRPATGANSAEFVLAQSAVPQIHPAAAANGKVLLTAWYEPKENELVSRVMAARVAADDQHLDGPGMILSETATPVPGVPVVGSDGDGFLVVWDEADGSRIAQRIGADGSMQTRSRFSGAGWYSCRDPHHSIAFNDSSYLVVSHCEPGAAISPASAIRLSSSGAPIDSPFALSVVPGFDPKVISTGSDWFVAREDSTNEGICGRVTAYTPATPAQTPNGSITIGGQTLTFFPGVFADGKISVGSDICLRNARVSQGQIYGATVTGSAPSRIIGTFVMSSGVIRKDIIVASGSAAKTQSAIATNGRTIFTAWKDGTQSDLGDIHGRILSLEGDVLLGGAADTPGLLLTAGLNSAHPSLAWDGNFYVLSWETTPQGSTTSDLMIRRFAEDGSTPDPAPVTLSATPFTDDHVQLVPFGTTLAAVYTREAIEPQYGGVSRVFVRRVQ